MRNLRLPVIVVFALIVSACGGGGGGGGNIPAPGGGAGPTSPPGGPPAPHSSGSPGPSSSPSSVPATPTPVPTQPGNGNTILPNTNGRFGLAQILDWNGLPGGAQLTQTQIQSEAPNYDSVWGAFSANTWDGSHSGMIVSRYFLPNEDSFPISGHDLAWWQTNNPDWVLYACDNNSTPTQDVAWYGTYFHDVPLNIHNPAVVNYQVHLVGDYMINNGYNTLAVDNVIFKNYAESPNPDLSEGRPNSGWYGCGVYTQPNFQGFQQVYSGGFDAADATWIADVKNWIATARQTFNSDPTLAPHHLKILINHPLFDSTPDSDEAQILSSVDGMLDENGFTHYDNYELPPSSNYNVAVLFQQTLSWMVWAQTHNIAIILTDYFCEDGKTASGAACSNDPTTLTGKQVDWALSTYAIGNLGGADLYISPAGGATYSYRSEYATRLGAPCGNYQQAPGVYYRKFANALVVVNPYLAGGVAQTASFTLPANHHYTDIEGRPVSSPLSLTAPDGYVLMTTNGCP